MISQFVQIRVQRTVNDAVTIPEGSAGLWGLQPSSCLSLLIWLMPEAAMCCFRATNHSPQAEIRACDREPHQSQRNRVRRWSEAFPQGAVTGLFASSFQQSASSQSGPPCTPSTAGPGLFWELLSLSHSQAMLSQGRLEGFPFSVGQHSSDQHIYTHPSMQLYSQKSFRMKTTDSQPNPSWGSLSIHQTGLLPGTIPHRWAVNEVTQIIYTCSTWFSTSAVTFKL